jgi:2-polyprenyl-3-methyl-5-hydroxy-6-metoxy-1,4-benzoquinol methylase
MNREAIDRWPLPPHLGRRRLTPEWMDDPALDATEHQRALAALARLNLMSRAAGILWPFIEADRATPQRPLHLLDVACGDGAILRALVRRARGRFFGTGIDISPTAIDQATRNAAPHLRFLRHDALDPATELPAADVVISSLFLHHLTNDQVVDLLSRMGRAARRQIIVSDLQRSRLSWILVWIAARLVTRSPVVHHDSARSVEAAWKPSELLSLARRAGLRDVQVAWAMPCRLILTARPPFSAQSSSP